jgi:hypothetical protein
MMDPTDPTLSYVFEFHVDVGPTVRVGGGAGDELHFVPITGGSISGPRLHGNVLPGGGDWWVRRTPYTIELDAHYLVRAADGAVIDVRNRGYYRTATVELTARADSGEEIDPKQLYYRTVARFQTDAPEHTWLCESIFVGLAGEEQGQVCIRFYVLG